MLAPILTRGPDAEGRWSSDLGDVLVAFGHRRLSILDLSEAANQPMVRNDLCTVYNGEIYNYVELRDELSARSHQFTTTGDTEVLLAAYREWGEDCVQKLNGMFAFAIWDARRRRLFCARDRLGEKPFFYWSGLAGLVFGSELESVLRFGAPVPRALDAERLDEFMATSWQERHAETFFRGIRELPAGHRLIADVEDGRVNCTESPYWNLPEPERDAPPLTADELRELFDDSVRLRLRSDVPIGTSISGGVDSPSVVAAVRQQAEEASSMRYVGVHAYAPVPEADERTLVREVAEHLDLEVEFVEVTGEGCAAELDELIARQGEPFLGPSIYAQRCVFRRASELGLRVMFDGQGADELFGGYDWVVPKALAALWRTDGFFAAHRALRAFVGPRFPYALLLGSVVLSRFRGRTTGLPDCLSAALRASLLRLSLPSLLRYADRNSMSFGVEARLPFLDHRLVEAAVRLSARDCAADGFPKALLRTAMRGRVPESVLYRRDKTAFAVPETQWIRGPLCDAVREAAADPLWSEVPNGRQHARAALEELDRGAYHRMSWKVLCATRWHDLCVRRRD